MRKIVDEIQPNQQQPQKRSFTWQLTTRTELDVSVGLHREGRKLGETAGARRASSTEFVSPLLRVKVACLSSHGTLSVGTPPLSSR